MYFNFFYKFGTPFISHDKYFYGENLLLAPRNIYQKKKTESVYLILKNSYVAVLVIGNFPNHNINNDDAILRFFYATTDNILVILHAKFFKSICYCG